MLFSQNLLFWLLAAAVTAIACAALYYAAAGRRVNAAEAAESPELAHLRLQLKEIESDLALGRLGPAEADAARAEVAREVIRLKGATPPSAAASTKAMRPVVLAAVAATAMLTGVTYYALGSPSLPAQPLAERTDIPPAGLTLEDAVAKIEDQLAKSPDDVRGWSVIAPAYMQMGRFADAANALRKVIALSGETADRDTDLGEALMMQAQGVAAGEPMSLFQAAAALDPAHVRSRYYIASELTRAGDFAAAKKAWADLLAMAKGDETWVDNARLGLAAAENNGVIPQRDQTASADLPDATAISGMVEGLSNRLAEKGGSIEEWTRLVRSRLVLHQVDEAQKAYEAARAAYPDPAQRTELDVLAADNGLVAKK